MDIIQTAIAPAIAFLAVMIAGMQWWGTRQKFVFDLFERRFKVFMDARTVASEALQLGKIQTRGLTNEIFARGQFLFGDEMVAAFTKLHSLAGEVEVGRPGAGIELSNHFDSMLPMFRPYLKMPQRMPSLSPSQWCR